MLNILKTHIICIVIYHFFYLIYSYSMDDDSETKKAIGTKKCVIKRMPKLM